MEEQKKPSKGHVPSKPSGAFSTNEDYRKSLVYQDEFAIANADPERHYRFVSRRVLDKTGGFDRRGWIPINASNSKGECLVSAYGHTGQAGTEVIDGDLVLAFMPADVKARKEAMMKRRQDLMQQSLFRLRQQRGQGVESMEVVLQRQGRTENLGFSN